MAARRSTERAKVGGMAEKLELNQPVSFVFVCGHTNENGKQSWEWWNKCMKAYLSLTWCMPNNSGNDDGM